MLNGLWHVSFTAAGNEGGGAVVINNGRALGGDAACSYIGEINEIAGKLSGRLAISHLNKAFPLLIPGHPNYTLLLEGTVTGDQMKATGTMESAPPGFPKLSIIGTLKAQLQG